MRPSESHLNWRRLLKRVLPPALFFLACFAVLCLAYPLQESSGNSLSQALAEYEVMTFVVTCIVVVIVPLLTWWCYRLEIWMTVIIRTVATFAMLWIVATSMETRELRDYWPASQMTHFFSELRVIVFAYEFTPLISLLAGVYYALTGRRKTAPLPSTERFAIRGRARERHRDG